MKLQEALDYLKLEVLPKAEPKSNNKCIALVRRTNNTKDYVIVNDGGIIADINFKATVVEILEYYPKKRESKEVEPTPPPPAPATEQEQGQTPEPPIPPMIKPIEPQITEEPVEPKVDEIKQPKKDTRAEMLVFLQSKKMKLATINSLSDKELTKLCAVHGKKF